MTIPNLSLAGRAAIVTGGKRGLGRAIALALAEAGADVAICSRTDGNGELQAVAEEIRKLDRRALAVQTDISRKTDVDNLVQRAIDEFGFVDILVNNAAIAFKKPLLEFSEDEWDQEMDVNLKGYFLCSQAVARGMVERKKGSIISIASQLAFKAWPNYGTYCIAKAGVVMLTRQLARDLAKYNIRVNAVAPASIKTEFTAVKWDDPEALKQYEAGVPLGYLSEPDDLVGPVLFLVSDASKYITGHTILADGGINA